MAKESAQGSDLRPVPAFELLRFHADLARQLAGVPDGAKLPIDVE